MKMAIKIILFPLLLFLLLCLHSYKERTISEPIFSSIKTQNIVIRDNMVTYPVTFVAYDKNSKQTISNVKLVVINKDGEVIDVLTTDKNGEAEKKITVPLDKKYFSENKNASLERGTVTVIAYKEGYSEAVIFETPISSMGAFQRISMYPVVTGQRDEPEAYIGINHHHEIGSLVDKYRKYIKNIY